MIDKQLKAGDIVRIRGPYGTSFLRQRHTKPIMILSAGTGLAPLLSILRAMAESRMLNPVHIYTGFMTREEAYGIPTLHEYIEKIPSVRGKFVLIGAGKIERGLRRGLLTEAIDADFDDLSDFRVHAFGSPFAIDAVVQLLRRKGVPEDHLHVDAFHSLWN